MTSDPLALALLVSLGLVAALVALALPVSLLRVPAAGPLAVYAFVLPWGSAVTFPGAPDPFNTLSTLVGLAVTFSLLLRLVVDWRSVRRIEPSILLVVAFFGWLVLTVLWSIDPRESLVGLAVLSGLVALYVLGGLTSLQPHELRWIEVGAVAGALVVAAQALLTAARGGLDETSSRLPRFTYDDGDPNILAATLLLPLAVAVWWSLTGSGGLRRGAATAASVGLICGLVVMGSRGGLLSGLVVLLVLLVLTPGLPVRRMVAYLGGLVLLLTVTLLAVPEGLRSHLSETDSTGRSEIWRIGLKACLSSCDVGSGYATFGGVYRQMYLEDLSITGFGDSTYAAHNVFLAVAVEAGIPGLLLLLAAFVLLIRSLLNIPRQYSGPAIGAVVGLITSNMLVSNLGFKYFWLTLLYATLVAATRSRAAHRPDAVLVER